MNDKLQELYECKIKLYEEIIDEIKKNNFEILISFEKKFNKIETINKQIYEDQTMINQIIMKMKL